MAFSLKFTGDGLPKFEAAVKALGSDARAKSAYSMALNKTNTTMFAQVSASVGRQVGVGKKLAIKRGNIIKKHASKGHMQAEVQSEGGYLEAKDSDPKQSAKGVRASPWGQRRLFGGTFIIASIGGGVFKRTGKWNKKSGKFNAIEKLYGASIPKEIVKDASEDTFNRVARTRLPIEIAAQIKRLTKGAVT